jgi:hypothetical protein
MQSDHLSIADDRLEGVAAIADFRGEDQRRTQYLIDTGRLPVAREGRRVVASKAVLLEHWRKVASGELVMEPVKAKPKPAPLADRLGRLRAKRRGRAA